MVGQHFIDPDSPVAKILEGILEVAGSNFSTPYDSGTQPHDVTSANNDTLIQYQGPAGSQTEGHANPTSGGGMGAAINSMLALLSPFISAYALILPILGVIRGIIEVICAMMNPFAVIAAVIRLFAKWLPPFISLFPPAAGIIVILSTIKAILAIIFYIMTEVVPVIALMVDNIKNLAKFFANPDDLTDAQLDAAEEKLESLLATLIQKTGVLAVFAPLLELIFLILRLVAGFPCIDQPASSDTGTLLSPVEVPLELDSFSCDESACPPLISDRSKNPKGVAIMFPSNFGDCAPNFIWRVITANPDIKAIEQFQESLQEQLECLTDEPVKYARPVKSTASRSLFKVRITGRRGRAIEIIVPVLDISGTTFKFVSPLGFLFNGVVNYEILPDYEMLIMQGIIGLGCHPDVKTVKDSISSLYDLNTSALVKNPEAATLLDDYNKLLDDYNKLLDDVKGCIDLTDEPPFDNKIRNAIIARNDNNSLLEVDKKQVKAGSVDKAIITITPKDTTGALLVKNIPAGVDIPVDILTDFGDITNQKRNNRVGTITAEIRSDVSGVANITAKVAGKLVTDFVVINNKTTIATRKVEFIPEAILPIRRKKSKSSGTLVDTGATSEREPGNR